MKNFLIIILAILFYSCSNSNDPAESYKHNFIIIIQNSETKEMIEGVNVSISRDDIIISTKITDSNGRIIIDSIYQGKYEIEIYKSWFITKNIDLNLSASTKNPFYIELDPAPKINITGKWSGSGKDKSGMLSASIDADLIMNDSTFQITGSCTYKYHTNPVLKHDVNGMFEYPIVTFTMEKAGTFSGTINELGDRIEGSVGAVFPINITLFKK